MCVCCNVLKRCQFSLWKGRKSEDTKPMDAEDTKPVDAEDIKPVDAKPVDATSSFF